ncbi:hypothetical protein [Zhongshania sp.]|uniref:hypothetical protein n=1 Tax=Zhongshania sp. TaxID=1971902 RepID=UPI003569186E
MALEDWKPVVDIFAGLTADEQDILFTKLNESRELHVTDDTLRANVGDKDIPATGTLLDRLEQVRAQLVANATSGDTAAQNIVDAITTLQTELKGVADSDLTTVEAAINAFKDTFDTRDLATGAQQGQIITVLGTEGANPPSIAGTGVLGYVRGLYDKLTSGSKDTWQNIFQHNIPDNPPLPSGTSITIHPILNTEPNVADTGWILNSNPVTGVKWKNQRLTIGGDTSLVAYVLNANDDQGTGIRNEGTPFLFPAAGETRVIGGGFYGNYYRVVVVNQSGQTLNQLNLSSDGGTADLESLTLSLDAPVFGQFPGALNQTVIRGKMQGLDQYEPIGTDGLGRLQTINGSNFSRLLARQVEDHYRLLLDAEPGTGFIFLGSAPRGTLKSTAIWEVVRIELSATLNPKDIQYKNSISWDDRYNLAHWDVA